MTDPASPQKPPKFLGLIFLPFVVAGLYFALGGFGVFDLDPKPSVPGWLIGIIGLAFFCAGSSVMIALFAGSTARDGTLPETAPQSLRAVQMLLGGGVVAGLVATAIYVALNPDPQNTTASFTVLGVQLGGDSAPGPQIAFVIGAVISTAIAAAMLMRLFKKWRSATK
jgi:predicted secreted protein